MAAVNVVTCVSSRYSSICSNYGNNNFEASVNLLSCVTACGHPFRVFRGIILHPRIRNVASRVNFVIFQLKLPVH